MNAPTVVDHPEREISYAYRMYGLLVRSQIPLPIPQQTSSGPAGLELVGAPDSLASPGVLHQGGKPVEDDWFRHLQLDNGESYLQWPRLGEFWISPDGRRIACRSFGGTTPETFHTYLVPQAVSCALVNQGIEPLHATVAVVDGEAVAFLGNCGYGKSSLGAAFLRAGHRLLTDDLLVIGRGDSPSGRLLAHPGPARIKLFPGIAGRMLGPRRAGVRMNPETRKCILPLMDGEHCSAAVPLKTLYVLRPPSGSRTDTRVSVRTLSPRRACIELIANTFNLIITDKARLARQLRWASGLASAVPVKSLSYPRRLSQAGRLVEAICRDLGR
jgi:hypothetical protein